MAAPASTTTTPDAADPTATPMSEPHQRAVATEAENPQNPMLNHPHQLSPLVSLVPPSSRHHRRRRPARVLRLFRSLCRTLPIFTPRCKFSQPCGRSSSTAVSPFVICTPSASPLSSDIRRRSRHLVTGTLFGYRNGRVSFSLQENSRCLPSLVVELSMQTQALLREMSTGMVRIALECERKPPEHGKDGHSSSPSLLDESLWTMFCNGKKCGYGVRRDASEGDLMVMETLRAVSMGAGVLPSKSDAEGEMAYVRAGFEHVIGSRDSETLYMTGPDDGDGPDLTIFFVRL
ncbi:protein MIZU-KUSSEI 1-like [Musa acuminata AAA Group]|uniref:protein MIZU-KUSSEI 1-like n=1 Tax=Musa acuminata AAA Group TaxID=214697 RepID=UPI0031D45368